MAKDNDSDNSYTLTVEETNFSSLYTFISITPFPICICNREGRYISSNSAHQTLFMFDKIPKEAIARYSLFDDPLLIRHGLIDELKSVLNGETVKLREIQYNPHDFMPQWPDRPMFIRSVCVPLMDSRKNIERIIVIYEDITEQKKLENEILRLKQVDSLGSITGGVAHDFSNLLTALLGNISILKLKNKDQDCDDFLLQAELAAKQLSSLNQQLLSFAKGVVPNRKTVSVSQLLTDTALFWLKGSQVDLKFEIDGDLWGIEADVDQFSQVIQNLVINARDAMDHKGDLRIRARNVSLDECFNHDFLKHKAPHICIAIKDSGPGISREMLNSVFDPFFTTKKRGHGLGLSLTRSIIDKHFGQIKVTSLPGSGAEFEVFLPAVPFVLIPAEVDMVKNYRGFGRVLLIDDEELVLKTTAQMLTHLGYQVCTACNGDEAVGKYLLHFGRPDAVEIVIMDFNLKSETNGCQAAEAILKTNPEAKIIISTGMADTDISENYTKYGFVEFLPKPYSLFQLSRVVHAAIHGESDNANLATNIKPS